MSEADVLYHYCSTDSFLRIVESHELRLSSLTLANDTLEGKLVTSTVARLADKDKLVVAAKQRLQQSLDLLEEMVDGLGFCLSEDGDLLSQWRGYARDGKGVAIGFSRKYLEYLAQGSLIKGVAGFTLQQVKYDPAEHEAEVHPTYIEVKKLIDAGAFAFLPIRGLLDTRSDEEFEQARKDNEALLTRLSLRMLELFPKLFLLKSPAFREEREWRLLSYLLRVSNEQCAHRATDDTIVPYRSYELREIEQQQAMVRVMLGPKHLTPSNVVADLLKQRGYGDVAVIKSAASYR